MRDWTSASSGLCGSPVEGATAGGRDCIARRGGGRESNPGGEAREAREAGEASRCAEGEAQRERHKKEGNTGWTKIVEGRMRWNGEEEKGDEGMALGLVGVVG